jgi:hypothetical protein
VPVLLLAAGSDGDAAAVADGDGGCVVSAVGTAARLDEGDGGAGVGASGLEVPCALDAAGGNEEAALLGRLLCHGKADALPLPLLLLL